MSKTVAAVMAAMLLLVMAPAHGQTPKRGGIFHVPAPEAPTLDPHLNAGFVTQVYASLIYSNLPSPTRRTTCTCPCGPATSSIRRT